jgi:hypothetical protein
MERLSDLSESLVPAEPACSIDRLVDPVCGTLVRLPCEAGKTPGEGFSDTREVDRGQQAESKAESGEKKKGSAYVHAGHLGRSTRSQLPAGPPRVTKYS